MNKVSFILMLICSLKSYAQFYSEEEMKRFFSKNKECDLAIGMYNPSLGFPELKTGRNLGSSAFCITDIASNSGTIREKKGCGLVSYNVHKGVINTTYLKNEDPKLTKGNDFAIVENVDCSKGGFYKAMELYPGAFSGERSVKVLLSKGPQQGVAEKVFLYASNKEYENYWRKNYIGGVAKPLVEEKTDCSKKHLLTALTEEQSWECDTAEGLKQEMCNNEFNDLRKSTGKTKDFLIQKIKKMNSYYSKKTNGKILTEKDCGPGL